MEAKRAAYDEVAAAYQKTQDPDGTGLADPTFDELVGDVRGQRVLSLACGQGRDARRLADLGADVVGVDISTELLAYARKFEQTHPRGIQYVRGDAQDLAAFADASFDVVVCHLAMMDIPDLGGTVASAARVLRPGCGFVASVVHPCFRPHVEKIDDYLTDHRYEKDGATDWLPPHAYHRPVSTYVNTLVEAGFSITRMIEPPDEHLVAGDVPNLLYVRCRRSGS